MDKGKRGNKQSTKELDDVEESRRTGKRKSDNTIIIVEDFLTPKFLHASSTSQILFERLIRSW